MMHALCAGSAFVAYLGALAWALFWGDCEAQPQPQAQSRSQRKQPDHPASVRRRGGQGSAVQAADSPARAHTLAA